MVQTVNANALRELSKGSLQPIGLVTIHLPPKRCITVVDWSIGAGGRDITININSGTLYLLQEGIDWFPGGSNTTCAASIVAAINAINFGVLPRVRARQEGERVIVAGGATTVTLTIDLSAAGAGIQELISPAPATRSFFLGDRQTMGPSGALWGGYPLSVANMATVDHSLDALSREFAIGDMDMEFVDDGEIRRILRDQHLRGRQVDIAVGTPALAQADFHPLGTWFIEDVTPQSDGSITVRLSDAMGFFRDSMIARRFVNMHPIQIFREVLEVAALQWALGIGLAALDLLVDRNTLVATVEPAFAHHTISRYDDQSFNTGKPIDEPEPVLDILNSLLLILGGTFSPDVNNRYRYRAYDQNALAARTWRAGAEDGFDIEDVVIKETWGNIANEIAFDLAESDANGGQKTRFVQRNENSRNEIGRLFQLVLDTDWCNGVAKVGTLNEPFGPNQNVINSATTSVLVDLAARQGFTGSRFRLQPNGSFLPDANGDLDSAANPPRRGFFRLHGEGRDAGADVHNLPPEIIAFGDSAPEGNIADSDNVRGDIPRLMRFYIDTAYNQNGFVNGRAGFGTTTPSQWNIPELSGTGLFGVRAAWIVDITIPVEMVLRRMSRFAYGAPVLEVRTGLDQIALEVGDFVALQGDFVYLTLGKDGLTASTIFEITRRTIDPWSDSPGITWELTWVRDDVVGPTYTPAYPTVTIPITVSPLGDRVLTESLDDVLTDAGEVVLVG
jgi:hypothetical protein